MNHEDIETVVKDASSTQELGDTMFRLVVEQWGDYHRGLHEAREIAWLYTGHDNREVSEMAALILDKIDRALGRY